MSLTHLNLKQICEEKKDVEFLSFHSSVHLSIQPPVIGLGVFQQHWGLHPHPEYHVPVGPNTYINMHKDTMLQYLTM